ncbi:MAG: tetratricopeptide repeat-containing protein [Sphingobacteriaceae bacterium]|nr:MAG: tetratricopeptide repeat-containing protein [Sphingobacteriaceae bacterium]
MDWYRQKTWSKTIEDFFYAKLARARKDGRAQYLKVQAIELIETKDNELLNVAETLIAKLFLEYPEDKFNRPCALEALGKIYQLRQNFDKAIEYYKQAIDFEIVYPQVKTQAYLYYSELVVKSEKTNLYELVEKVILERINDVFFPIEKYIGYSILSIISNHKKDFKQAEHFAKLSELYATKETSGLRYHKYLGVVKERDNWLDRLVKGTK